MSTVSTATIITTDHRGESVTSTLPLHELQMILDIAQMTLDGMEADDAEEIGWTYEESRALFDRVTLLAQEANR